MSTVLKLHSRLTKTYKNLSFNLLPKVQEKTDGKVLHCFWFDLDIVPILKKQWFRNDKSHQGAVKDHALVTVIFSVDSCFQRLPNLIVLQSIPNLYWLLIYYWSRNIEALRAVKTWDLNRSKAMQSQVTSWDWEVNKSCEKWTTIYVQTF